MISFKEGRVDPRKIQKYLANRNGWLRPVFIYKHRRHDVINIRQDKNGKWLMLAVDEHRMSRMFRIDSDLYYDGKFFYMSADDAS